MKLVLWLLLNMMRNLLKGDLHEAWDSWNWVCFHSWYLAKGDAQRISEVKTDGRR